MKKKLSLAISFITLLIPGVAFAVMTSTNYSIIFDAVGVSGGDLITSTSYTLSETVGETPVKTAASATYTVEGGYQAALFGTLSFSLDTLSINLGQLSTSAVNSANVIASVTSENSGYNLSINNVTGSMPANVVGGTVTAGTESYGFSATGPHSLLVGDVPVLIGTLISSSTIPVYGEQTTLTFKAAASTASIAGTYSQAIDLVASAN